jgi:hypothetical protein
MKVFVRIGAIIFLLASCTIQKTSTLSEKSQLKFLGEYDIPHNLLFQNTTVGGLSGIDYDHKNQIYYLISDDRSAINPVRFYTAKIYVDQMGIDSIQFVSVNILLQAYVTIYPKSKQDPFHVPDP